MRNLSIALIGVTALAGAAGAGTVFFEDFENGNIGQFTYEDYEKGGSAFKWDGNGQTGLGNYTDGTGNAATSDSDFTPGDYDHAIVSPVIALGLNSVLTYQTNYQNFANLDFADTDISLDGVNWKNLLSWNEDHGGFYGTPGEQVNLDLSAYDGQKVQIRFHHYDPGQADSDWYWQVDDIRVTADPIPAPGAAALLGLGGLCAARRRRA